MAFIEAIGPLLARFSPGVRAEPKIGGSMMRINRDIRFSKDKRPYKDHLDMTFKLGPAKTSPGYWFRLTPKELILGAGMHMLDKPDLERYRKAVDADRSGASSRRSSRRWSAPATTSAASTTSGSPQGSPPTIPREALLRHAGVYVGTDMKVPAEAKHREVPSVLRWRTTRRWRR